MSMMIGGAFSRGMVSMRTTPSSDPSSDELMSSSAGSDIGSVLLRGLTGEKRPKWRDFVGGAFHAQHCRTGTQYRGDLEPKMWSTPIAARRRTIKSTTLCFLGI